MEEVVGVPAKPLLARGVLHDGVGAVGGNGSDAVLRVREVGANLEFLKILFLSIKFTATFGNTLIKNNFN